MSKKNKLFFALALALCLTFLISFSMFGFEKTLFPNLKNIENEKYPEVVAQVGDVLISGADLSKRIEVEKANWEYSNLPQEESFYERSALQQLVLRALLDKRVKELNITVTNDEAKNYLMSQIGLMESSKSDDSLIKQFKLYLNDLGYTNLEEYSESSEVISVTQKILARLELEKRIKENIKGISSDEITNYIKERGITLDDNNLEIIKTKLLLEKRSKAWSDYKKELLKTQSHKEFVDINIIDFDPNFNEILKR